MLWEELTEPQFRKAVVDTGGVCVFPIGAVERHGPHLPLGTDMYISRYIARLATEIEPAIVFPYFPFGQISEASHYPGTIVTDTHLLFTILDATFREIARNGCKKILVLNAHGTNPPLLEALAMSQLRTRRDYSIFIYSPGNAARRDPEFTQKLYEFFSGQTSGGHAGNFETSLLRHIAPDLVDMGAAGDDSAEPLRRLPFLNEQNVFSNMFWYADYPNHYAGSPANSSAEAGQWISQYVAQATAQVIKTIREDTQTALIADEFYQRSERD